MNNDKQHINLHLDAHHVSLMVSPEQEPFFVGTYFPKESRGGQMAGAKK